MRSFLLATSLLVLPGTGICQNRCGAPDQPVEETFKLPPVVDSRGGDVSLLPASQPYAAPALPAAKPATPVRAEPGTVAGTQVMSATPKPQAPAPSSGLPRVTAADASIPILSKDLLNSFPALAHMTALGATVSNLGISHDLQTVVASNAGQFMAFVISPDGQAVVAGLMTDISLPQMEALAGSNLVDLPTQHGLRAVFLHNGPQFQVFYVTPDGERLIPGVMWDAAGKDVTHDQIAAIPGTIPTVVIGKEAIASMATEEQHGATPQPTAVPAGTQPSSTTALDTVLSATYPGRSGKEGAQEVWMFVDPDCPFSIRAMNEIRPLVDNGTVRLSVVTLSVIDYENSGASTRDALGLLSLPGDQMIQAWMSHSIPANATPMASAKLKANMLAAQQLNVKGTPTFLFREADGTFGRSDSLPSGAGGIAGMIRGGRS